MLNYQRVVTILWGCASGGGVSMTYSECTVMGRTFHSWLVVDLPLWKIWKSVGMMTFPIYGTTQHVPNHQPDSVASLPLEISRLNVVSVSCLRSCRYSNLNRGQMLKWCWNHLKSTCRLFLPVGVGIVVKLIIDFSMLSQLFWMCIPAIFSKDSIDLTSGHS